LWLFASLVILGGFGFRIASAVRGS
jgi:hypothetical protein